MKDGFGKGNFRCRSTGLMPVPKYRTSRSKRDSRRAHHAVRVNNGAICPNCDSIKRPHRVCDACGHYRGRQVMEPKVTDVSFDEASFDTNA